MQANMNTAVEEPSKIIKMSIKKTKYYLDSNTCEQWTIQNFRKNTLKTLEGTFPRDSLLVQDNVYNEIRCSPEKMVSIDFFSMNEENVQPPRYKEMENDIYNTRTRKTGSVEHDVRAVRFVPEEKFIKVALENDVRVKYVKYVDETVFVYFFLLDDAISFYMQFAPYVQMSFSRKYDFEQVLLLSSSELTGLVYSGNDSWLFENENPSGKTINTCLEPLLDTCSKGENGLRDEEECYESEGEAFSEEMHFHTDSSSCSTDVAKRTVFERKVSYFRSLRSFFSKNEVSAMVQNLEVGDIRFVFRNVKELTVGSQSNKIMQAAIGMMSNDDITKIVEGLGHDIAPIATNKHGAYVVQTLISALKTTRNQKLFSKYFLMFGGFLITHEIGNYTVQKVLRFDPELIFNIFLSNIEEVANSELGMKVLKRSLSSFPHYGKSLLERIKRHTHTN